MLRREFEELVKMTREHLARDPEREVTEREEASDDPCGIPANAAVVTVAIYPQLQGLTVR
jgi:hypothetical protein